MQEVVRYILAFLLGKENIHLLDQIAYTADEKEQAPYPIVIIPADFFNEAVYGTSASMPTLPLKTWQNIPLLFGKNRTGKVFDKLIISADIIASSFFLLTRYEEMINRDERDQHGRFPGKSSLPYRAEFINRPIVDEYGQAFRNLLRENGFDVREPASGFSKIYLTHDVDQLAHYRRLRGVLGGISRFYKNFSESLQAIRTYLSGVEHDPWFTFPWAFELSDQLKDKARLENILFIKTGGGNLQEDHPLHDIRQQDFQHLFSLAKQYNATLGLHPSYQAGIDTKLIVQEKQQLDDVIGIKSTYSRNHFLANREPEDMQALIDAGFRDDFTLAYADYAGFRLGTCRAVRWINPATKALTSLSLHPLSMMDNTLSDTHYMNFNFQEAKDFAKETIDTIYKHRGELVLLWHNTMLAKKNGTYQRELYEWIIHYTQSKIEI